MLRNIIKFLILLSLLTISCNQINNKETIHFSGKTLEEEKFDLKNFEGQPVIINFWYPSCPPCVKEIPNLVQVKNKYSNKIKVIGILHNSPLDSKESAERLLNNLKSNYVNIFDKNGEIEKLFSIQVFPTSIFLNHEHQITTQWSGYLDNKKLEELISEVLIK